MHMQFFHNFFVMLQAGCIMEAAPVFGDTQVYYREAVCVDWPFLDFVLKLNYSFVQANMLV